MTEPTRILRKECIKTLPVIIGDGERDENTERLLKALDREEELKAELAGFRADINTKLKGTRKTIKDMRASLDQGTDVRELDEAGQVIKTCSSQCRDEAVRLRMVSATALRKMD